MIRQALRPLARSPAYALTFVATLALGCAVSAASVAALRGVLLAPLPHLHGERLVHVRQEARLAGLDNALLSVPEIRDLRSHVASFEDVAEFSSMRFTVLGMDRPRRIHAGVVSGNYFAVMGLRGVQGRVLQGADDGPEATPVAVLTYRFWRSVLGGDAGVVGSAVRMNGRAVTIVGVVEDHPAWPERTDLYVNMAASPHHLGAAMSYDRTHRMTEAFARLAPGATLEMARTEVEAVMRRGRKAHPEAYDPTYGWDVTVATLRDRLTRRARPVLWMLGGVTGLVLVVVVVNVANLALTRTVRLGDELSVRVALGARGRDLRRRLLAENLALATAGALVGAILAWPATALLTGYLARFTIRAQEVRPGWTAVPVAVTVALVVVAALASALPVHRTRGLAALAGGGNEPRGVSSTRLQKGLVTAQVAVSFVLLTGAGLLARTVLNVRSVEAGLDSEGVLVMDLPPVQDGRTPAEIHRDQVVMAEKVEALAAVRSVGLTNQIPLRESTLFLPWTLDVRVEGGPETQEGAPLRADFRTVSPGYFGTLGIRVEDGRGLEPGDDEGRPLVAVVNRAFARRYLEGPEAVGHRLAWTGDVPRFAGIDTGWRQIVGVVADVRNHALDEAPRPTVYVPVAQESFAEALVVRAMGDPTREIAAVTDAIHAVLPTQPVENAASLDDLRNDSVGDRSMNARMVGALAAAALVMVLVGIFGLLSYRVDCRMREVGIRMALGADRAQVVTLVLREGVGIAAAGVLLGGPAALGVSRLLAGLLYGMEPTDVVTLTAGAAALAALTLAAAAVPAWRAARVEPTRVLGVR